MSAPEQLRTEQTHISMLIESKI